MLHIHSFKGLEGKVLILEAGTFDPEQTVCFWTCCRHLPCPVSDSGPQKDLRWRCVEKLCGRALLSFRGLNSGRWDEAQS